MSPRPSTVDLHQLARARAAVLREQALDRAWKRIASGARTLLRGLARRPALHAAEG